MNPLWVFVGGVILVLAGYIPNPSIKEDGTPYIGAILIAIALYSAWPLR